MPETVPVAQARVPVGSVDAYLPFLVPQLPLIGALFLDAVQEALVPVLAPSQDQVVLEP